MLFSSTGAYTAGRSTTANHYGHINAQLYSAFITQIFRMRLFVNVESVSNKLLKTASKSGPNGRKERARPQKMLMRIKIEGLLGRKKYSLDDYTFPQTTTGRAKNDSDMNCSQNQNEKHFKIFRHGYRRFWSSTTRWYRRMHGKEIIQKQRSFESWIRLDHFNIRSISLEKHVFCDGHCEHRRQFLEQTKDLCEEVDDS